MPPPPLGRHFSCLVFPSCMSAVRPFNGPSSSFPYASDRSSACAVSPRKSSSRSDFENVIPCSCVFLICRGILTKRTWGMGISVSFGPLTSCHAYKAETFSPWKKFHVNFCTLFTHVPPKRLQDHLAGVLCSHNHPKFYSYLVQKDP